MTYHGTEAAPDHLSHKLMHLIVDELVRYFLLLSLIALLTVVKVTSETDKAQETLLSLHFNLFSLFYKIQQHATI
jgi:hypothetical protein